jgi:2-iminobutanoate/2-iminopropanoate deaminase
MRCTVNTWWVVAFTLVAIPAHAQQLERFNPPELGAPEAYTHVVKAGKLLFIAGQVATTADGTVVGTSMVEQFDRVLRNLSTALKSRGADFSQVAKITIYVTDVSQFLTPAVAGVRRRHFGAHRPASTLVQIQQLANPAFKVEVEAIAVLP